jgi:hypothetical protein
MERKDGERESRPKRRGKPHLQNGRDEMNLVEFPFALLSDRGSGELVLEYQVEDEDRETGLRVTRKLTVTGDPKHGLPTAKDEEVYLGLLQLTKLRTDFRSPAVRFTRHELIQLLGWPNKDWAYERLVLAFARLVGVRLFYQKAWRDNDDKVFKDRGGFGLLDSYQFRDGRMGSRPAEDRLSEFRWSAVLFESFRAGYLKRLDYELVRSLGTKAKRLYRYLDKHFNPPKYVRLAFDLRTLACERLGLSRDYDAAQLRRQLRPAVDELERIGFVVPAPDDERYRKLARGRWEVVFERETGKRPASRPRARAAAAALPAPSADAGVERYLAALSPEERQRVRAEAEASAEPFLRGLLGSGTLAETASQVALYKHVARLLRKRSGST